MRNTRVLEARTMGDHTVCNHVSRSSEESELGGHSISEAQRRLDHVKRLTSLWEIENGSVQIFQSDEIHGEIYSSAFAIEGYACGGGPASGMINRATHNAESRPIRSTGIETAQSNRAIYTILDAVQTSSAYVQDQENGKESLMILDNARKPQPNLVRKVQSRLLHSWQQTKIHLRNLRPSGAVHPVIAR